MAEYKGKRFGSTFSIIIIDLDGFKAINDTLGHLEGDAILKSVADTITRTLRPTDLLARWGGDEFLILMEGALSEAHIVTERIRSFMPSCSNGQPVSFSCGISQYIEGDDLNTMTHRADEAMYKAKEKDSDCRCADDSSS
jgi:diguanylate cyclase (GGDEF)-like protein